MLSLVVMLLLMLVPELLLLLCCLLLLVCQFHNVPAEYVFEANLSSFKKHSREGGRSIVVWGGWRVRGNGNWLAVCRVKDRLQSKSPPRTPCVVWYTLWLGPPTPMYHAVVRGKRLLICLSSHFCSFCQCRCCSCCWWYLLSLDKNLQEFFKVRIARRGTHT